LEINKIVGQLAWLHHSKSFKSKNGMIPDVKIQNWKIDVIPLNLQLEYFTSTIYHLGLGHHQQVVWSLNRETIRDKILSNPFNISCAGNLRPTLKQYEGVFNWRQNIDLQLASASIDANRWRAHKAFEPEKVCAICWHWFASSVSGSTDWLDTLQ
jgi:hypothetical protein